MGYPVEDDRVFADWLERDFFVSARARHGPAAWRRAEEDGERLSYDEAIACARDTTKLIAQRTKRSNKRLRLATPGEGLGRTRDATA